MKVREFIKIEKDIDVYDDVCEELGIAFCGPMELTSEGEKEFAEVMDYDITVESDGRYANATVHVDDPDEKTWKHKLRMAENFFYSAAGYCADEDFRKWFKEVD